MRRLTLALGLGFVLYCGWRIGQHRQILTNNRLRTALGDDFEGLADAVEKFYSGGKT